MGPMLKLLEHRYIEKAKRLVGLTFEKINENRIDVGAASLAFYLTLATLPALISLIAILAYLPIEGLERTIIHSIAENAPGNAGTYLIKIVTEVLNKKEPTLVSLGFITTLWLSSSGMSAILNQMNFSFGVTTTRNFAYQRLVSLGITLIYVGVLVVLATLIIVGRKLNALVLDYFGLSYYSQVTYFIIKYGFGLIALLLSFALIYYLGPRKQQRFRVFSLGGLFGSLALVMATLGFDFYISNFAAYNEIYGSLGGIIIYMFWLYISGFILLLGAEINASYYND